MRVYWLSNYFSLKLNTIKSQLAANKNNNMKTYTYKLIFLAVIFAACDSENDELLIEKFIVYEVVDPARGTNLVNPEGSLYHPDSIRFYDKDMKDIGLVFLNCLSETNPSYSSGDLYVWTGDEDFWPPSEMPIKLFYLKLSQHDTDTLELSYRYKSDSAGKWYYGIVTVFNGSEIERYQFSPGVCGVGLPKF